MAALTETSTRHYLADLRSARAAALADSEGFDSVLFAIERLGAFLLGSIESLGKYRAPLRQLAARSVLAWGEDPEQSVNTLRFEVLFDLVNEARNDALHQGAAARHITRHCVDLVLILEDALVTGTKLVSDFMASTPIAAQLFEPVGSVRRTMLLNSYSYLPVKTAVGWQLVADAAVARFLRDVQSSSERKRRLGMPLEIAFTDHGLQLVSDVRRCIDTDAIDVVLAYLDHQPVLVMRNGASRDELVGLVTAFDLL